MNTWLPINESLPEDSGTSLLWLYAGQVILGRYVKGAKAEGGEAIGFSDEQGRPVTASHYRYREPGEATPAAP